MKKSFFILFFVFFIISLSSNTITVKQDGTGDYTIIQEAINESSSGDTILVYPGIYYENLLMIEKNLILASLNLVYNDTLYISNTIIDANFLSSCIFANNVENATIQGFTMINGIGYYDTQHFPGHFGGAINSKNSNLLIKNNYIFNNEARMGGGINIIYSSCILSGNKIYDNHAFWSGGGIQIVSANVIFDENNLNSIYYNSAGQGNDIMIANCDVDIRLKKFTVMEPDNFFIKTYDEDYASYTFSCEEAAVEPLNCDLYVSASGNDYNSGTTPQEPLQTIAKALIKIKSDSLHPNTIHVANGIYSKSLTNELFALNTRAYVSIIGESKENTILDGENQDTSIFLGMDSEEYVNIKNFTIRNLLYYGGLATILIDSFYPPNESGGAIYDIENINISNINTLPGGSSIAIGLSYLRDIYLKNIDIRNCMTNYPLGISSKNVYAENIKITNISSDHSGNSVTGGGIKITCDAPIEIGEINKIVGLEISNSEDTETEWPISSMLYIVSNNEAIVSNASIVENSYHSGYGAAITLEGGNLILINSIVYNYNVYSIRLNEDATYGSSNIEIYNSLIEGGQWNIVSQGSNFLYYDESTNIDEDPQFVGEGDYPFALSSQSPCIDAGTLDLPEGVELPERDLAGNPRIVGASVDMGAYEYQGTSSNEDIIEKPKITSISVYPNPFSLSKRGTKNSVKINLELSQAGEIELSIYNLKGQKVKRLIKAQTGIGTYNAHWDLTDDNGKTVSSGLYFVKLVENGKVTCIGRITLLK